MQMWPSKWVHFTHLRIGIFLLMLSQIPVVSFDVHINHVLAELLLRDSLCGSLKYSEMDDIRVAGIKPARLIVFRPDCLFRYLDFQLAHICVG